MPLVFAGGNNTSATANIGGGVDDKLIIDITVADPDGIARVVVSSESTEGEKIRFTDDLAPTCPTSKTYRIGPRDSTSETYDVGVLDCQGQGQPSVTHINADGSSEPTEYEGGPVVGAPVIPLSKPELLVPYIGLASAVIVGAVAVAYLKRSKQAN